MLDDGGKGTPPALQYLAVFNPAFGPTEETTADQLCFFYPPATPIAEKCRQIGLAQALVSFTRSFGASVPCESVHTQKSRVCIFQPENGYWMVLKVRLGTRIRPEKHGKSSIEYRQLGLQDSILKHILVRAYRFFRFLHQGFQDVAQGQSIMVLRKMMEEVFLSYIQRVDFAGLDVMNGLSGINYASMNRQSFLKVATFINRLKSDFPLLKYGCLLWHDQLVWSSTRSPSDLQDVYDYFTDPETGRVYDGLINQVKRKGEPVTHGRRASLRAPAPRSATSRKGRRFTGYLVGPPQLNTVSTDTTLKEVYIGDDGDPYFLIVYQFEDDTTFIFLIPTSAIVQPLQSDNQLLLPLEQNPRRIEFYVKLADHLNKNLAEIAQVVQAGWTNARQVGDFAEQHFRYLYFNSSTLSFKSSISRHKTTQLTPDLIHCLNNMHEDFLSMSADGELTELNLQTTLSDAWVVGRRNNSREFYMVFPKSEASVVDIDDDVEKFSTAYLQETRS